MSDQSFNTCLNLKLNSWSSPESKYLDLQSAKHKARVLQEALTDHLHVIKTMHMLEVRNALSLAVSRTTQRKVCSCMLILK